MVRGLRRRRRLLGGWFGEAWGWLVQMECYSSYDGIIALLNLKRQ